MKLVEILAKELEEWPPHAFVAVQDDDDDHTIWFLQSGHRDLSFMPGGWKCESQFDILISRPSQLAHDHATAIVTEADWKKEARSIPDQSAVGEIYNAQAIEHGPLQWRDRIAEIDSTTQDLTTERAELVQKLASEGFALIGRVVEPVEDMSDWRNWKEGDLLEMVKASDWEEMTNGKLYEFAAPENRDNFAVVDDNGELRSFHIGSDDFVSGDFKWHSRPSA